MNFTYTTNNGTRIEFYMPSDPTLPELLEAMQRFIKACGYHIPDNVILDLREEDV